MVWDKRLGKEKTTRQDICGDTQCASVSSYTIGRFGRALKRLLGSAQRCGGGTLGRVL